MSSLLNTELFEQKLYESLPRTYRVKDEQNNLFLKRYLSAISNGGFAKVLEETNGLLDLVDPSKAPEEILPILFESYGFEMFNGMPADFIRKLLMVLGDLYSKKGSIYPIEYLTSVVSGVKSDISIDKQELLIRLEMDFSLNDETKFPTRENLVRIIDNFIPFFCTVVVVYVYAFADESHVTFTEFFGDFLTTSCQETQLFGITETHDTYNIKNSMTETQTFDTNFERDSVSNMIYNVLNGNLYTNTLTCYDKVTTSQGTDVIFY